MVSTTRTLNPLPFGDLDPHRFEDLVRQLAYDFRLWRKLEATGRTGADEGYDARGWEIVSDQLSEETDEDEDHREHVASDRCWLIQCKRERQIGPQKLHRYMEAISDDERKSLYGIVVAAACDFSKRARDEALEFCRSNKVQEWHFWGKAELEDMLFQPKNDHLLFAYFGVSLNIRRKSVKSDVRSRLSMKRKAVRLLGSGWHSFRPVLLRDPGEERYLYIYENATREEHLWAPGFFTGHYAYGIKVHIRRFHAYLAEDGEHWDMANIVDDLYSLGLDRWLSTEDDTKLRENKKHLDEFVLDHSQKSLFGQFDISGLLRYEDILDIDDIGDQHWQHPQIYVVFQQDHPPFCNYEGLITIPAEIEMLGDLTNTIRPAQHLENPHTDKRIKIFPDKLRKEIKRR